MRAIRRDRREAPAPYGLFAAVGPRLLPRRNLCGLRLGNPASFRQPSHRTHLPQKPPSDPHAQNAHRSGGGFFHGCRSCPYRLLREINRLPCRVKTREQARPRGSVGEGGVTSAFSGYLCSFIFGLLSFDSRFPCGCYKKQSFITALMNGAFGLHQRRRS